MQFFNRFFSFNNRRHLIAANQVNSAQKFREILARERARSDRSGQLFSIVSFDVEKKRLDSDFCSCICDKLVCRVRATDEVGWVDDHHLGAILHNASAEEAIRFADTIRREFSQMSLSHLPYQVYTYPDESNQNKERKINKSKRLSLIDNHGDILEAKNSIRNDISPENLELDSKFVASCRVNSCSQPDEILPLLFRGIPVWKRLIDVLGSLLGLILLSPLFGLIALHIKLVSQGPVFFKQKRIGCCRRIFTLWKFRTMINGADTSKHQCHVADLINGCCKSEAEENPMIKLEDDPQIIPFGKALRALGLDELPQLFNVLRGEMSLVGPRPPIPYEVEEYLHWHNGRLDTLPGLTGLWQISGKNSLSFTEMVRLDIRYTRYLSFWQELKILFMTPKAVFVQAFGSRRKG